MSQTLGMERNDCMNGRKRKVQIKFYVTEEERALIEQKMKLVPTQNMAAYLRKIAIDGYIIQTDHSDIKAMTAEIQKIGVNVNQIAKRVNATGSVYQEKRVLEIHNESIDADEKRQSLRIAQMEDSDIYKKIHTEDCVKLTDDEWRALEKLLDQTFNNFTARLKKSYPKISYKEIQVCYLTKIKLSSTKMTKILRYNSSPLRSRLYKKIFKKTGSVQDFNSFIAGF